jgi:hypothetical protein
VNPAGEMPVSMKSLLGSLVQIGSLRPFTLSVRIARQSETQSSELPPPPPPPPPPAEGTRHVHPFRDPDWHVPNALPAPTGVPLQSLSEQDGSVLGQNPGV